MILQRWRVWKAGGLAVLMAAAAASCGSSTGNGRAGGGGSTSKAPLCTPGAQATCGCPAGVPAGVQVCKADGSGFGWCGCGGHGGGTTTSSSTTSSTSSTTSSTSSSTSSTSTGGSLPPVSCAGAPCLAGQVCCYNPMGAGAHCGQAGQCGQPFIELTCSTQADCPGQVCCAWYAYTGTDQITYGSIKCQATCGVTPGMLEYKVCTNQPNGCPVPDVCFTSQALGQGYMMCAPPSPPMGL